VGQGGPIFKGTKNGGSKNKKGQNDGKEGKPRSISGVFLCAIKGGQEKNKKEEKAGGSRKQGSVRKFIPN